MRAAKATAQSFPALLSQQVAQFRHSKDLVRYGGVETPWTIDEFGRLLSQHAAGLLDARVRPRDDLLLHLEEFELENVVSFLAAALVDVRVASFSGDTVAQALSGARAAVVSRANTDLYFAAIPELERTSTGRSYRFVDFPQLKMLLQTGRDPLPGFYTYEGTFVANPIPDPVTAIAPQVTSESEVAFSKRGGTGRVSFTQGQLVSAGRQFGADLALSFQDRVFCAVPQNRLYGITTGIVPCVAHAALFVLDGPTFDPERQASLLASEQCTAVVAAPSLLGKVLSAKSFAGGERVTKVGIVVDQASALEKQSLPSAIAAAKAAFPKLAVTVVSTVDDRVSVGPITTTKH